MPPPVRCRILAAKKDWEVGQRVSREVDLDLLVEQLEERLRIGFSIDAPHDLHVLLRHRLLERLERSSRTNPTTASISTWPPRPRAATRPITATHSPRSWNSSGSIR